MRHMIFILLCWIAILMLFTSVITSAFNVLGVVNELNDIDNTKNVYTEQEEEEVIAIEPEVDKASTNAIKYCNTLPRWENNYMETSVNNYHGVQVEGEQIDFPWIDNEGHYFADSYEHCMEQIEPYSIGIASLEYYTCNVHQSMLTCEYFGEFVEESGVE